MKNNSKEELLIHGLVRPQVVTHLGGLVIHRGKVAGQIGKQIIKHPTCQINLVIKEEMGETSNVLSVNGEVDSESNGEIEDDMQPLEDVSDGKYPEVGQALVVRRALNRQVKEEVDEQ